MKLEIDSLTVSYRKTFPPIINNLSFTANGGEIIGITGPNGIGKTTLLKTIFGIIKADSGVVTLNTKPILAGDIAFMEQNAKLLPMLTVAKNLNLPLKLCGVPKVQINQIIKKGLNLLNLTKYASMYPSSLSKGTEQRVMLLRTVLFGCDVLLFDEPFSAMDRFSREFCKEFLTALKNQGKIIILTAHRPSDLSICTKTISLLQTSFAKAT